MGGNPRKEWESSFAIRRQPRGSKNVQLSEKLQKRKKGGEREQSNGLKSGKGAQASETLPRERRKGEREALPRRGGGGELFQNLKGEEKGATENEKRKYTSAQGGTRL